jgi:hypothetical protein
MPQQSCVSEKKHTNKYEMVAASYFSMANRYG